MILLSKLRNVPEMGLTMRKTTAREYRNRLNYLTGLITSMQISNFNEFRKKENFSVLDLRHVDISGDWEQNGKLRPLYLENIILKKSLFNQSDLSEIRIKNSDLSHSNYYLANLLNADSKL